jgi:uncharacterized membrane protein YfcA
MLEATHIFILVMFAAFVGSINGLGITFLVSIFLILIDKNHHQNHAWIPYFSTFLISLIFIVTRLRIVLKNISPILCLCIFSAVGLLIGKIFKESTNLLWLKMFLGAVIFFITYYLNKYKYFSKLNISILSDEIWSFSTTDNFIILIIGFVGGLLDFSLAVLIYTYLIFNKEEYNVEHLDVCVYSTLALTSFINFIFFVFTKDAFIPEYFNFIYVLALFAGAISARSIYHLITLDHKRKFLIFALYSLGFKLLVLNFLFNRFY